MPDATSKYLNRPTQTLEQAAGDRLIPELHKIAARQPTFEEYAAELIGLLWRADDLAQCLGLYPSLDSCWWEWHIALVKVAREVRAAQIVRSVGLKWGEALPDWAEPYLQLLAKCRQNLPSPTYDNMFYVRVRDGRALIVHRVGVTGFDKHFWEWVAGAPLPPAPALPINAEPQGDKHA